MDLDRISRHPVPRSFSYPWILSWLVLFVYIRDISCRLLQFGYIWDKFSLIWFSRTIHIAEWYRDVVNTKHRNVLNITCACGHMMHMTSDPIKILITNRIDLHFLPKSNYLCLYESWPFYTQYHLLILWTLRIEYDWLSEFNK